jgi:hypothetical protein
MDQMGPLAFPSELTGVNRNDLTAAASPFSPISLIYPRS